MQERELARLESRRTEPGEDRTHRAVHDVQDLVPSVDLEHERLPIVVGEREVPRRARGAEPRCAADSQRHAGTRNDRNDPLQHTGLGEDLDAVVGAIAHIHQVVVAYGDAMRMAAVARGKQAGRIGHVVHRPRHAAPLPQPGAGCAEHHDAVVAVSVRDVDATAFSRHRIPVRIDVHVGRLIEQRLALVGEWVGPRVAARISRRVVAHTARPDLQQQPAAIMRILLHDAIAVAGDPDVVLVVDEAAVNAVGQHIPVAPGVHHASVGVEFDNGCRRNRIESFGRVDEVSARHNEHMIPRVDAGSRDFAGRPWLGLACRRTEHERGSVIAGARQRHLRPRPIDCESRYLGVSLCVGLRDGNGQAQRSGDGQSYGTGVNIMFSPHDDLLVELVTVRGEWNPTRKSC